MVIRLNASFGKGGLPRISNAAARRLFLQRHALGEDPSRQVSEAELLELIERLGFVQLDSINTVERAHHMILFSRRQCYNPGQLKTLLEKKRALFEHWTHDASIIPSNFYPYWHLRFERSANRLKERWREWRRDGFEEKFDDILKHIQQNGPAMSRDMGEGEKRAVADGGIGIRPKRLWNTFGARVRSPFVAEKVFKKSMI